MVSTLLAGTMTYVSYAYLHILLPGIVVVRSAAVTTYETGLIADPCTILAVISNSSDISPPYRVL